jgi:hypothetical protein
LALQVNNNLTAIQIPPIFSSNRKKVLAKLGTTISQGDEGAQILDCVELFVY